MSYKVKFDFVRIRRKPFLISAIITIAGIVALLAFGLNYGVDFTSGTRMDISVGTTITKEEAEAAFLEAGLELPPELTIGGDNDRVSVRFDKVLAEDERTGLIGVFESKYGEQVAYEENTVDAGMAKELGRKAIFAVAMASLGIALYVSIRFEWRFALSALIALLHGAFVVVSIFSIFRLEVNLTFVAAILTIIGYAINDTIVTFDRIRENLKTANIRRFDDLAELVNESLWQTLTRSINTAATVLFAALALFIFGSESLRMFSLAMVIGLTAGAYSSVFIASQVWLEIKAKSLKPGSADPKSA
ncbi:hypothetical protein XYCOK13_29550 [Xylanibacillus composti]|uniref:Protein-export membrane protein SecF n=1 Tax=Xylanibacillus composti TaxID=1572762 RepID=A0A8J4M433_9BACL|nr:protein translocase subunit SecF [Xylanibacillus composti]GIQ70131.1 hypothetical protein XYCOK13_29550 [Xylanibacillus composti]